MRRLMKLNMVHKSARELRDQWEVKGTVEKASPGPRIGFVLNSLGEIRTGLVHKNVKASS